MNDFNKRYLEFCLPFVDGVRDVFKKMVDGTEIKPQKPHLKSTQDKYGEYTAIMGMNGLYENSGVLKKFTGSLIITWDLNAYLKTASKMLMSDFSEMNDDIKDVGMEICNITMGNAKKVLNPMGYKIDMSIPNCIQGSSVMIDVEKDSVTVIVPFESCLGNMRVELNYKETDKT